MLHARMVLAITLFTVAESYGSPSIGVSASGRPHPAIMLRIPNSGAVTPGRRIPGRCRRRIKSSGTVKLGEGDIGAVIPSNSQVWSGMFDDLFRSDDHDRLVPMMASAIPTLKNGGIKDGGRTVIIHLKPGLRWSNNTEITAADIRFGWRVDMDSVTGPVCAGTCDVISRIDTPDRYTAVLRLKRISPALFSTSLGGGLGGVPFLWPSTWAHAWRDNPHAAAVKLFQDASFDFFGLNFPTNGPYYAVRRLDSRAILFRPMPFYDDMTCGASVANVVSVSYPTSAAELAGIDNRRADAAVVPDYALLPDLQSHSETFALHSVPTFEVQHLAFNVDPAYQGLPNPVANTKVRLALALATDKIHLIRQALTNTSVKAAKDIEAWSFAVNTTSFAQPFADRTLVGQWDPIARTYVADTGHGQALSDARRLLATTPWKQGFSLDFYSNATGSIQFLRQRELPALAANWERIGVKLNVHFIAGFPPQSPNMFGDWASGGILDHGAYQVSLTSETQGTDLDSWKFDFESKYVDRAQTTHSSTNQNNSGIHNAVIDRDFERAGRTFNRQVRSANYAAIQREVNQRAYWIPLNYSLFSWSDDRRMLNLTYSPGVFGHLCWDMYAWKLRGH